MNTRIILVVFNILFILTNFKTLSATALDYWLLHAYAVGSPIPNAQVGSVQPDDNDNVHNFLHWHSDISYKLNEDSADSLNGVDFEDVENAISNAAQTWSYVDNCWMDITYNGSTSNKNNPNDGINTIYWDYDSDEDLYALTLITNQSACNNQQIRDVDIFCNTNAAYPWTTYIGEDVIDIQALILHEMGHGVGIAHNKYNEEAVMWGGYKGEDATRTLHDFDKWAIQYLYPETKTYVPHVYPGVKSAIQIDGSVDVDVESGSFSIAGSYTSVDNVTIKSNASLTLNAGTTLDFTSGKKLTVNGTLVANGTSGSLITLKASTGTWNGVKFESANSSSSLKYCKIQNTTRAIHIDNSDVTIESNEIDNCSEYGIYIYNAEPTIYNNYIHDTDTYAIAANSAGNTFIRKSSIIDCYGGVAVWGTSTIKLRGQSGSSYGLNKIDNWGANGYGVYVLGGTPDLGQYSPSSQRGYNDILRDTQYAVYKANAGEMDAEKNYWGSTPQSSWFYGDVNYDFPLSSSQGAGSDLEKSTGLEPDKDLLVKGNELADAGRFQEASDVYKSLINQFPDSRHAGKALAWAMAAENSLDALESQRDYLEKMKEHENPKVRGKALLWLQTLEAHAGNRKTSEDIVNGVPIDDATGWEIRTNWANDRLNVYGDSVAADKVFDELQKEYPDQVTLDAIQMIQKTAKTPDEISLPKPADKNASFSLPHEFSTSRNYPNPFNPSTTISYTLPQAGKVTLKIFDIRGREVAALVDMEMPAGIHTVAWNGTDGLGINVTSGIYFYRIRFNNRVLTGKMILVR